MSMFETVRILEALETLRDACHKNSVDHGFWDEGVKLSINDLGDEIVEKPWNMGEKIALIHSELSEMLEAHRKNAGDSEKDIRIATQTINETGLPLLSRRITAIEEEVADVLIRMLDLCGKLDIDVGRVVLAKMEYNQSRPHLHGRKY